MKVIVLHGDDIERSRKRLQKFLDVAHKRNWSVITISGKTDSLPDCISSTSLFGESRLLIVDDAQHVSKESLAWFGDHQDKYDDTICFFASKQLTPTQVTLFGKAKVEVFETPRLLWKFLDSIFPGNLKSSMKLFHEVVETEAVELVFVMIARHVRDMYHVLVDPDSFKAPDWRKGKLKSQARKFGEANLKNFMSELADIDVRVKTSNEALTDLLDFCLIQNLE